MCKTKQIYTSRINYSGSIQKIDITRKSATRYKSLSPTWDMVTRYKDGSLSKEAYIKEYDKIMVNCKGLIEKMLEETANSIVLVCYCTAGTFCHRVLLAKFIEKEFNAKYVGEI